MILKNVIRKENFWKYVLVFFVSLFLNFSLIILLSYFQENEYQRINTLENRSLVANVTCDELKKDNFYCKDNVLIFKERKELENFVKENEDKYDLEYNGIENNSNEVFINILKFFIVVCLIINIVIIFITVISFVKDDNKTNQIYHVIGYSKRKLLIFNYLSFMLVYSMIFFLIMLFLIPIIFIININIKLIYLFLIIYLLFMIIIFFTYLFFIKIE